MIQVKNTLHTDIAIQAKLGHISKNKTFQCGNQLWAEESGA